MEEQRKTLQWWGEGHREQARQVCAETDLEIAQPFSETLQKELNALLNKHSLAYVNIDVTYGLAMQSMIWPLTGQGLWDNFAETFDPTDFDSRKALQWSEVYRRYDQLLFYPSNKFWQKELVTMPDLTTSA